VTVTDALALAVPLLAVTVPEAAVFGAVSRPAVLIVPTLVVQVKVGCEVNALPNWSLAVAVNCC